MNRRTFFAAIAGTAAAPQLPAAAPAPAALPISGVAIAHQVAEDWPIIMAALQFVHVLAPGQFPSKHDVDAVYFHLRSLRGEYPRHHSQSLLALALAERIRPLYWGDPRFTREES